MSNSFQYGRQGDVVPNGKRVVQNPDGVQCSIELCVNKVLYSAKVKSTSIPFASKSVAGVLFVDKRDDVQVPTSVYTSADQIDFMNQPQYLSNRITEVLNKSAKIQDFRYKFEWNQ